MVNEPVSGPSIAEQVAKFNQSMGINTSSAQIGAVTNGVVTLDQAYLEEEAQRRHPIDHDVDDPFGETGIARSDPYGYEDTARAAFIEGAQWVIEQLNRREA